MAFKVGKVVTNALIIGLLVTILIMLVRGNEVSGFADLLTNPGKLVSKGPQSITEVKDSLKCTPGPSEEAGWYSRGLTPGGLCNDDEFVTNQMRDYTIADGIGGSLLEK
jgi:hypothetical protein